MTELQETFRDAVRDRAKALGVTQQDLAAQVGCTPKHLSRMLGGHNGGTFELWQALFDVLGIRATVVEPEHD